MPSTPAIPAGREVATLAGGCFWCLEAVFDDLKGVDAVESGYMGGRTVSPTYEDICTGDTGHAEVVRVTYDPKIVGYRELLEIFFEIHDPTTLNRQGNDVGTQYRSAIFFHSAEQERVARELIAELDASGEHKSRIVTEVVPEKVFYVAEDYHQEYYARVGDRNPYCTFVVAPKLARFRQVFAERARNAVGA